MKRMILVALAVVMATMTMGCVHSKLTGTLEHVNPPNAEIAFNIAPKEIWATFGWAIVPTETTTFDGKYEMERAIQQVFADKAIAFNSNDAKTIVNITPERYKMKISFKKTTGIMTATVEANGKKETLKAYGTHELRPFFVTSNQQMMEKLARDTHYELATKIRAWLGM
ncbi:MAG: hypothetical protein FD164_2083 [Nitrospirae bacterium]|nr:MAG: hypothetical protein FD164_2083 [Nitrospirota bacterium]